jgi:hypothetical protein
MIQVRFLRVNAAPGLKFIKMISFNAAKTATSSGVWRVLTG